MPPEAMSPKLNTRNSHSIMQKQKKQNIMLYDVDKQLVILASPIVRSNSLIRNLNSFTK